mgnify:CR=1 FL=1
MQTMFELPWSELHWSDLPWPTLAAANLDLVSITVFSILTVIVGTVLLLLSELLGPRRRDPEKETIYECGVPLLDSAREPFTVKFYLVAILFILFDIIPSLLDIKMKVHLNMKIAFIYKKKDIFRHLLSC